ncbi:hypothetical protein HK102_001845 [Quaeritorhiza haematococci]|nr:hypothetical protein HK102_001845 [Quaeritorhiza haematococci]
MNDDNIIKVLINKKLNVYERNYHLIRVFMYHDEHESDTNGKIRTYKTIGVNSTATIKDMILLALKKFKLREEADYAYSLHSVFRGQEVERHENEPIQHILQMAQSSPEDIDFVLRRTWIGAGSAPRPPKTDASSSSGFGNNNENDLENILRHKPAFLTEDENAYYGTGDRARTMSTSSLQLDASSASASASSLQKPWGNTNGNGAPVPNGSHESLSQAMYSQQQDMSSSSSASLSATSSPYRSMNGSMENMQMVGKVPSSSPLPSEPGAQPNMQGQGYGYAQDMTGAGSSVGLGLNFGANGGAPPPPGMDAGAPPPGGYPQIQSRESSLRYSTEGIGIPSKSTRRSQSMDVRNQQPYPMNAAPHLSSPPSTNTLSLGRAEAETMVDQIFKRASSGELLGSSGALNLEGIGAGAPPPGDIQQQLQRESLLKMRSMPDFHSNGSMSSVPPPILNGGAGLVASPPPFGSPMYGDTGAMGGQGASMGVPIISARKGSLGVLENGSLVPYPLANDMNPGAVADPQMLAALRARPSSGSLGGGSPHSTLSRAPGAPGSTQGTLIRDGYASGGTWNNNLGPQQYYSMDRMSIRSATPSMYGTLRSTGDTPSIYGGGGIRSNFEYMEEYLEEIMKDNMNLEKLEYLEGLLRSAVKVPSSSTGGADGFGTLNSNAGGGATLGFLDSPPVFIGGASGSSRASKHAHHQSMGPYYPSSSGDSVYDDSGLSRILKTQRSQPELRHTSVSRMSTYSTASGYSGGSGGRRKSRTQSVSLKDVYSDIEADIETSLRKTMERGGGSSSSPSSSQPQQQQESTPPPPVPEKDASGVSSGGETDDAGAVASGARGAVRSSGTDSAVSVSSPIKKEVDAAVTPVAEEAEGGVEGKGAGEKVEVDSAIAMEKLKDAENLLSGLQKDLDVIVATAVVVFRVNEGIENPAMDSTTESGGGGTVPESEGGMVS